MKKTVYVITIIFLSLLISGCSNKAYEEAMEKGIAAIENEEYAKAEVYFEEALEEKEDDEEASSLLKQVKDFIKAVGKLDEGDIKAAREAAENAANAENKSEFLIQKAEELKQQIVELEERHEKYLERYETARKELNEENFDEAIAVIDSVLEEDLSHPYFNKLTKDFETLKEEITTAKEKALAEAEAKRRAEEEKKKKEAEQREKERKEAEEKAKKEAAAKDMGAIKGYWLTEAQDMACHITDTYYACAVRQSDVMFQDQITNIETVSEIEKKVTTKDGYTSTFILMGQNTLQTEGELLYRVSKTEANAIYEGYYELP